MQHRPVTDAGASVQIRRVQNALHLLNGEVRHQACLRFFGRDGQNASTLVEDRGYTVLNKMHKRLAQFIGVCSNAKPGKIGENLFSVSDPISRPEERLIHASTLVPLSTLQRRPMSSLHPYT